MGRTSQLTKERKMKTMQEKINGIRNPKDRELCQSAYDSLCNAIVIPNDQLPSRYHQEKRFETGSRRHLDGKVYGRTPAELERIYSKEVEPKVKKDQEKADRMARLARYSQQVENGGEIQYEVNEVALYAHQVAYCSAATRSGAMEEL